MTSEEISDRHLRAVDGLAPVSAKVEFRVRILSRSAVTTVAGQHLAICLVNLLCRMTDLVSAIDIDVPIAKTLVASPNAVPGHDLAEAMRSLVAWATGDEITVDVTPGDRRADICLCIGDDVRAERGAISLHALADGWRAWVGTVDRLPKDPTAFTATNPLGAFFAASILAGEVFKRTRGITRGRFIEEFAYSLWSGETGNWAELKDGPPIAELSLPPLYVVGAGAVGQGLINLIGASAFGSSYLVTIDDDIHDITNFNRCFVAGVGDKGDPKIDAVTRYRGLTGIGGIEFRGTISAYVRSVKPGLRSDLAEREARDVFNCVVSCVDKGSSRQDIQGLWPNILVGGSTLGLSAKTIVYDLANATPCLACHNPPEKDGERLRKIEQHVRAMSAQEQREFLAGISDIDEVLDYLAGSSRCGSVGEASLRAFATQADREFSVSFVSMAASVLVASRLFARLLFGRHAHESELAPMTSLAFLNGSIDHARTSIDSQCGKCGGDPRGSFEANSPA